MKISLTIFALSAAFAIASGYLLRADVQLDDENFGLVEGRVRIWFTYNSSSSDYFTFPNSYLVNGASISRHLSSPSRHFAEIKEVYIWWARPGHPSRQYFRSHILLKNVILMPSERTADGKIVDHAEQSMILCTRNRKVVDLEYVQLHSCDEY